MKKILNFFKTFLYSIWPALAGACIVLDVHYVIKNIQIINSGSGSGWTVVMSFVFAATEIILALIILYRLGEIARNAKRWTKYLKSKQEEIENAIDGSLEENETSDEAADI